MIQFDEYFSDGLKLPTRWNEKLPWPSFLAKPPGNHDIPSSLRHFWSRYLFPWRVSNRGHEITNYPLKGESNVTKMSGEKIRGLNFPWKNGALSLFGSVLVSKQKKWPNSLPKPTQQKPNPPFGGEPSPATNRPQEALSGRNSRSSQLPPTINPSELTEQQQAKPAKQPTFSLPG